MEVVNLIKVHCMHICNCHNKYIYHTQQIYASIKIFKDYVPFPRVTHNANLASQSEILITKYFLLINYQRDHTYLYLMMVPYFVSGEIRNEQLPWKAASSLSSSIPFPLTTLK
jgi:hypothetical protein